MGAVRRSELPHQAPVLAAEKQKKEGLELLMREIYDPSPDGYSCKKPGEWLSWIGLNWIEGETWGGRDQIIQPADTRFGYSPDFETLGKNVEDSSEKNGENQASCIQIIWPDGSIEIQDTQNLTTRADGQWQKPHA